MGGYVGGYGPDAFRRDYRLTRPAEFERVLRQAKVRKRFGLLRVHALPNTMRTARLGLIVARRVARRAVDRNRTRRQIRESFRINRARLAEYDLVIQVTELGADRLANNDRLRQALEHCWQEFERS